MTKKSREFQDSLLIVSLKYFDTTELVIVSNNNYVTVVSLFTSTGIE